MTDDAVPGELPEDPDDRTSDGFATWLGELASVDNEDDLFEVLASQRPPASKLARQQIRGRLVKLLSEKLKELDSGVSAARTADAWLQEGGEDGDSLQGKLFVAEETVPWGDIVVGADVLDEVVALYHAYVYASANGTDALALWTALTHIFDCFGVAPLFDISSPTKRCGKSTAIVVLRHLCRAPLLSSNITPAALFRAVEAWKPTLLIDEADTFAAMNDELRGIINSGHTRDTAFVVRAEGDSNEPRLFSTWAPKVVAAIGHLPDTIEDRSIRLVLTRKPTNVEKRDAFDGERVRADCSPVRRRLARFVLDNLDTIAAADVERPAGLNDRAWNNWRPLFAIAAAAGGDWPTRSAEAAKALTEGADDGDGEDVGTLALQHVWEILEPAGRLPTAAILEYLIGKDEGPWAKWWESSVAKDELKSPAANLAKLLKPFGIRPRQLWIEDRKTRGYDAEDFAAPTVSVYLQKDGRDGKNGRTESSSQAGSTVPTGPTDFSEVPEEGRFPLLGDEGLPESLLAAVDAGHITSDEAAGRYELHKAIIEARSA